MRYIDLSVELAAGMPRHPAPHLTPVEMVPVAKHDPQRRSVHRVSFSTHVSTHLDAPLHAIPGGRSIDLMPLEHFIGTAALIRVRGVSKEMPIDRAHLEPFAARMKKAKRLIIETGWAKQTWGSKEYFVDGPYLTRAAAEYLATFKFMLIGMDFPNVDSAPETVPGLSAPNHNILMRGDDIVLLENLLRLDEVPGDEFELMAQPLKLIGGDGCPCRAVAAIAN